MNFSDTAEKIKAAIPAGEMFDFYGFKANKGGYICCPFHAEKTPSLKIFRGDKGWKCFGCGAGSSVIDFVMRYFRLDFKNAQRKLNYDFNVGLDIGDPISCEEQLEAIRKANERKRIMAERKAVAQRLQDEYDAALSEWIKLDIIKRLCAPKKKEDEPSDAFAYAVRNIELAAYRLDEAEMNLYLFRTNRHE